MQTNKLHADTMTYVVLNFSLILISHGSVHNKPKLKKIIEKATHSTASRQTSTAGWTQHPRRNKTAQLAILDAMLRQSNGPEDQATLMLPAQRPALKSSKYGGVISGTPRSSCTSALRAAAELSAAPTILNNAINPLWGCCGVVRAPVSLSRVHRGCEVLYLCLINQQKT